MTTAPRILLVDDDDAHRQMLLTLLRSWQYAVFDVNDGDAAISAVQEQPFDAVLTDVRMSRVDGITALREMLAYNPALPIVLMTAYSSVETAVEALRLGAYDYLTKPLDFEQLRHTLARALEHSRLSVENRELRRQLTDANQSADIVGRSKALRDMLALVATVAPTEATVLITGESGTGKELVARALAQGSPRADKPLVTVNCAALAENLLESELFGHEKGSFTGADKRREGRFVQANGGTLFLDEIGEMPITLQAKLLRALQQGEVQRVGSDTPIKVDVRIIAATNRDLVQEVRERRFREDLYFRLNVISVAVPSLRERAEDIPLLAAHFLQRFATRNRKHIKGFSPQALNLFLRYPWPGNVRELENAVERAVIMCTGDLITERELP
ncbi:MAG: sigma-54-dependent Fis family transcriptional regulator, partial [Ottowia sp.]|nr:sigma-54-dependent Fis family transcriptional regulator [Ottowia sp.]